MPRWKPLLLFTLSLLIISTLLPRSMPPPIRFTPTELSIFKSHTVNNTLTLIPINTGMLPFASNLLCSLHKHAPGFPTSKIIFWALDAHAATHLSSHNHTVYFTKNLFSVPHDSNQRGNTRAYTKMMRERPKFFAALLSTGIDLLMMDADLVLFGDPMGVIPQDGRVDAVYSTDGREFWFDGDAFRDPWRRGGNIPPVGNGFFWMRGSAKMSGLWREMTRVFEAPWWRVGIWRARVFQDDQRGMDVLLNDGRAQLVMPYPGGVGEDQVPVTNGGVRVRLLDQVDVVNGHLLMDRRERYEALLDGGSGRRLAAHFNWDTAQVGKEEGARELGMWYLDDNGKCV
ncbi:hypothetical protein K470DRAFT_254598 [Piedraia hortae CBS 480.64]|uniref:Nucleotide-diphospho-sugar transferase domain-containing protein n=1 Tax=Piedraia hortae CBS 480.64 TaxID=1314780 RepID=A0A6A7C8Y2_9PEZI|nr:hypothetical protein K470DRAFT_254598 [Piedraia hortae CBS 480.64]